MRLADFVNFLTNFGTLIHIKFWYFKMFYLGTILTITWIIKAREELISLNYKRYVEQALHPLLCSRFATFYSQRTSSTSLQSVQFCTYTGSSNQLLSKRPGSTGPRI